MRPFILSSLVLLPLASSTWSRAQAQENPAPPSNPQLSLPRAGEAPPGEAEPEVALDDLVARALANNPQPAIARANLQAAQERVRGLRSLSNPVLQVVPGIGPRDARDEEIILSQPLDVFGQRRARRQVLEAEARRAQAESTLAERALVIGVKNAAADLFAAQEAESLGLAQVEVAQAFRDAAARRAQLGDVPTVQVQRAELELLRVQNDLANARAERLARRAGLNLLIGQAPEAPLRAALPLSSSFTDLLRARGPLSSGTVPSAASNAGVGSGGGGGASTGAPGGIPAVPPSATAPTDTTGAPTGEASSSDAPVVGASSQVGSDLVAQRAQLLPGALLRPDIAGAQATLEARRAQEQVLARSRRPQIEIQARRNAVFNSGSTALRAVVTIPIFDFGSIRSERRAVQAEVRAQEGQVALLRAQAAAQVEQALVRLGQQRATVERYRVGIVPLTLDLLRKSQIGYAAGASTYLEVLEAQRTLRAVQTEYLQALVGTRTSEAQLESALGANAPANLVGGLANPAGPDAPPGVAAPGTLPPNTIPPVENPPLNPPGLNLPGTLPPTETPGGATP